MKFKAGESGNPQGRRAEPKPWQAALRLAVNEVDPDGFKMLRKLADKTVELGLAGDMEAIKEIGNRLDGRPEQPVTGEIEHKVSVNINLGR